MAQPQSNYAFTVETIPRFLNSSRKPDITVKRYWSRFKTYLNLTRNIIIEPLLEKQKTATENNQDITDPKERAELITALDAFKWVTGQETERHLIKAYPRKKVHEMNLYQYKTIWEEEWNADKTDKYNMVELINQVRGKNMTCLEYWTEINSRSAEMDLENKSGTEVEQLLIMAVFLNGCNEEKISKKMWDSLGIRLQKIRRSH